MNSDTTASPTLDLALFDRFQAILTSAGPLAAIDALCDSLRQTGDYQNLFYARLMRKRVELGVSPFPMSPATELPSATHEAYEETIREAGREAGRLFLERNDFPRAWSFYRMLGEPGPIRDALATYEPGPEDDPYPIIEIAWQQGVLPEKGFDLVLDRNGVCSAITMVHSSDLTQNEELRMHCIKRLVRALHEQLTERLRNDLESRGASVQLGASVAQMIDGREELFADDGYHIDTSHLSSVVQMAMNLPRCPELDLARELADYGSRLSASLRGDNDPPFENTFGDYKVYLDVLAGMELGVDHFRQKAKQGAAEGYQFPSEVLVNLLLRNDRLNDALVVATQYLADADERQLSCPGVAELARRARDYETLTGLARRKADPVTFVAGLIAAQPGEKR